MQFQSDPGAEGGPVRLPPQCTTVTAEDLRVRLVLAAHGEGELTVDASEVETVGQAVLQLLVAARAEAERNGQAFLVANPSQPFADRVAACRLADALGLHIEEESFR